MLDWERWTLTHSSGAAVVLALPLLLELGLAATKESSVAAVVLVDVAVVVSAVVDVLADGEAVFAGVELTLAAGGAVDDPVGESVATAEWLADGLAEDEEDGDGEWEGDGDGDGDGDEEPDGDGVGVGVPDEGSAWHTVSAFGVAVGAACAVPSAPRLRKLPLSKVTAATLTCAKRIRIACLRCSSGLPSSLW
jgi:hypothetical protein